MTKTCSGCDNQYQRSRYAINEKFAVETRFSSLIPVPWTRQYRVGTQTMIHYQDCMVSSRFLYYQGHVIGVLIPSAVVGNEVNHRIFLIGQYRESEHSYLHNTSLLSVGDTWRGFPTFQLRNSQVMVSQFPSINFESSCAEQSLSVTAQPTGFNVSLVVDNVPSVFRLFCTESDYATGITATGNNSLQIQFNSSHRLATSCDGKDTQWRFVPLFRKRIEWTVDLSTVPCGSNATFYAAKQQTGAPYRDGCVAGPDQQTSTEFDLMEANCSAWHTTLHTQNNDCGASPPIGFGGTVSDPKYLFRDVQTGSQSNTYGLGDEFTINTQYPFTASLVQIVNEQNILTGITLTLTQKENSIQAGYDATNEEYPGWLETFGKELNDTTNTSGNVLFWSFWTGDDLNWLESPPCPNGSKAPFDASYVYSISDMSFNEEGLF